MFKFNKNEELYQVIDQQKEQIARYESRLRDLVHAYKSLQKEKDALEESMKALTAARSGVRKKRQNDRQKQESQDVVEEDKVDVNEEQALSDDASDKIEDDVEDIEHLRSQLFTLTTSISTMSEEKKRIVAVYQAEKKQLKHENEVQINKLQEENEVLVKKIELLEQELSRVKEKLRSQQSDHDQEQATHSIMLREIQKMLNDERTKNETLELAMRDLRNATKIAELEVQQNEDYKRRVRQLENELSEVRERLQVAEHEANTPSPILLQLQAEMNKMKKDHITQLGLERHRVMEAVKRERAMAAAEEMRVGDLETRLVQISNTMGLYDGTRQKDLVLIQNLKDQVAQFDVENSVLRKKVEAASTSKADEDLDIEELKARIMNLQHLLKSAADKSNELVDISDVLSSANVKKVDYQQLYLESQEEMIQIKDDFERYKTRAQNVLKNMKGSSSGSNRELEESQKQVQEARERYFNLRRRCDDLEVKCQLMESEQKQELAKQTVVQQSIIDGMNENHRNKMAELEKEIKAQRERTVALLTDKDKEIKHLKMYASAYQSEYQSGLEVSTFPIETDPVELTEDSVTEILTKGSVKDTKLMHYVEQLARKDVAINSIRRQKKHLEMQIRKLQDAGIMKDENNAQEVAILKDKIAKLERGMSRENANVEYVKNVLFQYLTTVDATAKQKMLVAIATILQFSPEENKKVGLRTK